jgi:hypothetical protein
MQSWRPDLPLAFAGPFSILLFSARIADTIDPG